MLLNSLLEKLFQYIKENTYLRFSLFLRRQNISALNIAAGVLMLTLVGLAFLNMGVQRGSMHIAETDSVFVATTPNNLLAYKNLKLGARSIIVWDIRNQKVLYEHNADAVRPLASITKIMTAVTALDLVSKNTIVRVSPDFLSNEGDSGLFADESWKLKDLLDLSLVMSSNDGVSAIAAAAGNAFLGTDESVQGEAIFVRKMNEKASAIGLAEMHFINPTGLDDGTQTGGMGSARDVALLFEYALKKYPEAIEATRYESISVTSLDLIDHTAINTNLDINKIPGLIASKTGYTEYSGGNLAVVFDAGLNNPIVVVALGSTYEGRFSDVDKLVRATRHYLSQNDLVASIALSK